MRLVKVTVKAFQCIREAEVELGPGLNVLYGPNDLGKSSLAAAIRNVLLLPHGSSAHEQLVSWHCADPPSVELTFATEPGRYWRVRKTFGRGSAGSSYLEASKDGFNFNREAGGRKVDAQLRELLRWGVVKPGGKAAPRGLPDSFLINVLLAPQADVPAILARGLTEDGEESGRERLNQALHALAQDPLFKHVLDRATEQVARAFTPTGQRSRRKDAPFTKAVEEINALRSRQAELQEQLKETRSTEDNLQWLQSQLDRLQANRDRERERRDAVAERFRQSQARAAADEKRQAARKTLEQIKEQMAARDAAAESVEALRAEVGELERELADKRQAVESASLALQQAEDGLEEATSNAGARKRELLRGKLENERHEKSAKRTEVEARRNAAERARQIDAEARRAGDELERLRGQLEEKERHLGELTQAAQRATREMDRQKALEAFGRLREARRKLADAEQATDEALAEREKAAEHRGEAEALERQAGELKVPEADAVRQIAHLWSRLRLAEAKLGGGLSVSLRPRKEVRLGIAIDGEPHQTHRGADPMDLELQRGLELSVEDLIDITVTAGEAEARREVELLRQRWQVEGQPALGTAGVETVDQLREARRTADDLARRAAERRRDAQHLEQKAGERAGAARDLDGLRRVVAERERALSEQDQAQLAAGLESLGEHWEGELDKRRAALEEEGRVAAAELEGGRSDVTQLRTTVAERQGAYERSRAEGDQAHAAFPHGAGAALQEAESRLSELERAISDLTARIEGLSEEARTEETEAQTRLDEAKRELERTTEAHKAVERRRDEKREEAATAKGTLDALRVACEKLDVGGAESALAAAEAELVGLPVVDPPVIEEDVEAARADVKEAETAASDKRRELDEARGALKKVGGSVIREQKEEIDRALQIACEREREIEVEFEAWKLLMETLREAENTEGSHLGEALAKPLGDRLRALTARGYGPIEISRDLKAEGLRAAGDMRPFDALSAGTQDQLATLFRLCIAEQLESAIVLDDHLSQSDAVRVQWFRDLLRESAQTIQVVLLTCRPLDYLDVAELPEGGESNRDRAAGLLRAVDLERAIARYPLETVRQASCL